MKKILIFLLAGLFLAFWGTSAMATPILYDWAFNVDGTIYEAYLGDPKPTTGTLDDEALGTLTWTTIEARNHSFIAFFDHDIDDDNNTWFNEYGKTIGKIPTSQCYEIDEPGWGKNANSFGDICGLSFRLGINYHKSTKVQKFESNSFLDVIHFQINNFTALSLVDV